MVYIAFCIQALHLINLHDLYFDISAPTALEAESASIWADFWKSIIFIIMKGKP